MFPSAICAVLMAVITPVLQALLFRSQQQLLEFGAADNTSSMEKRYILIDASYNLDEFASLVNNDNTHFVGSCATDGTTVTNYHLNSTVYGGGAVYRYMYVDSSVGYPQAAILLVVSILGTVLLSCHWYRHSRMRAPYVDVATLAALATADPSFMRQFSRVADLDRQQALEWECYLKRQTLCLGRIPGDGYRITGRRSRSRYGFYFSTPIGESPERLRSRTTSPS